VFTEPCQSSTYADLLGMTSVWGVTMTSVLSLGQDSTDTEVWRTWQLREEGMCVNDHALVSQLYM